MKKRAELSIVVPVYNVEAYLDECIESILAQTFRDFELILVNDGSTDGSGALCDRYAAEYPDLVRVVHKANGGLSSARNAGLEVAMGNIIGFVDSDDAILPMMFADMAEALTRYDVDVVSSHFLNWDGSPKNPIKASGPEVVSAAEALKKHWGWEMNISVCTKLFKKEALAGIRFRDGLYNEDFPFVMDVLSRDVRVCMLDRGYYRYRVTPGSLSNVLRPNFFDVFDNLDYVRAIVPQEDNDLKRAFRRYELTIHIMSGVKIVRGRYNKKYKKWLRQNRRFILGCWRMMLGDRGLSMRWRLKAVYSFLRLP